MVGVEVVAEVEVENISGPLRRLYTIGRYPRGNNQESTPLAGVRAVRSSYVLYMYQRRNPVKM